MHVDVDPNIVSVAAQLMLELLQLGYSPVLHAIKIGVGWSTHACTFLSRLAFVPMDRPMLTLALNRAIGLATSEAMLVCKRAADLTRTTGMHQRHVYFSSQRLNK